ncbi:hypothetical protein BGZ95_001152, partial [Linnemannia exigua]
MILTTAYHIITDILTSDYTHPYVGSIDADKVTVQGQYSFDIVFSSLRDVDSHSYSYFVKTDDMAASTPSTNNNHIALTLLRDPVSVDVAFIFEDEEAFDGVGLWAHSVVLSKHRVFKELIQKAKEMPFSEITFGGDKQDESKDVKNGKAGSDSDSLCTLANRENTLPYSAATATGILYEREIYITLKNVSLTTMCALLYYVYTGGIIDLSVRLSRFAISRCVLSSADGKDSIRTAWCDTEGRFDDSDDWHPLENHSPWKLKDVNWSELWEVSTLFGIASLQTQCRAGVISGIDKSNAVDVLFSKAAVDVDIKNAAMAKVVENMGSILDEDKDPFALYRHHQEYHGLLIRLMRLKAKDDKHSYVVII